MFQRDLARKRSGRVRLVSAAIVDGVAAGGADSNFVHVVEK